MGALFGCKGNAFEGVLFSFLRAKTNKKQPIAVSERVNALECAKFEIDHFATPWQ